MNVENGVHERDKLDWYLLRTEIIFEEYVSYDTDMMTSELFTVHKFSEDK